MLIHPFNVIYNRESTVALNDMTSLQRQADLRALCVGRPTRTEPC